MAKAPVKLENWISLPFADGQYDFRLPLPRIDELQRKCGVGIGALYGRVAQGRYDVGKGTLEVPADAAFHATDLTETVRQALIGGNRGVVNGAEIKVPPALADRLITNYVLEQPLVEAWKVAFAILNAAMVGRPADGSD